MPKLSADGWLVVGVGLAVIGLVTWVKLKGARSVSEDVASGVVTGVADVLSGGVAGVVLGVGDAIAVPRTNAEKAAAARKAGDIWLASVYMPAGEFIGWIAAGMPKT